MKTSHCSVTMVTTITLPSTSIISSLNVLSSDGSSNNHVHRGITYNRCLWPRFTGHFRSTCPARKSAQHQHPQHPTQRLGDPHKPHAWRSHEVCALIVAAAASRVVINGISQSKTENMREAALSGGEGRSAHTELTHSQGSHRRKRTPSCRPCPLTWAP